LSVDRKGSDFRFIGGKGRREESRHELYGERGELTRVVTATRKGRWRKRGPASPIRRMTESKEESSTKGRSNVRNQGGTRPVGIISFKGKRKTVITEGEEEENGSTDSGGMKRYREEGREGICFGKEKKRISGKERRHPALPIQPEREEEGGQRARGRTQVYLCIRFKGERLNKKEGGSSHTIF